jgi:hypothetical protein
MASQLTTLKAFTVIAHKMLTFYGNAEIVAAQYDRLKLYMHYLANIPGVDPVVAPFVESGLLTYNIYSDWDSPHAGPGLGTASFSNASSASSVVPLPTHGPRGVPAPLISSWAYGARFSTGFCTRR